MQFEMPQAKYEKHDHLYEIGKLNPRKYEGKPHNFGVNHEDAKVDYKMNCS